MKVFYLLFLIFLSSPVFSQSWQELNNLAIHSYNLGEYEKGLAYAEKAAGLAGNEFGTSHFYYARCLNSLGLLYSGLGEYEKGESAFLLAIKIFKATNQQYYAAAVENLGGMYKIIGKYDKAEPYFLEALKVRKSTMREDHPDFGTGLNNLAEFYREKGDYAKAEPLYIKALDIVKNYFGEQSKEYGTILNNLGLVYQKLSDYKKSEYYFIKSMGIRKAVLGDRHPDYAISLANLGILYQEIGLYEKSIELFKQSVAVLEKVPGGSPLEYAMALNSLATAYVDMGDFAKAEGLYLRAKGIIKEIATVDYPDYALIVNNLAALYQNIGSYDKAEIYYLDAAEIRKRIYGEKSTIFGTSLNNLGELYRDIGMYDRAKELLMKSNEIFKVKMGDKSPEYAYSLGNLSSLFADMKEYKTAEAYCIRSMEINKDLFGEKNMDYGLALNNLGTIYHGMHDYKRAEALFLKAAQVAKSLLGSNHPYYLQSLANLALAYYESGQYQKAGPFLMEANKISTDNTLKTFSILSEKEKGDLLKLNNDKAYFANNLLFRLRAKTTAFNKDNFNQLLLLKSIALSDTRSMLESVRKSGDASAIQLLNQWLANKGILARQYSLPLNERLADLSILESRTEELEKELSRRSLDFQRQQKALKITVLDIQKNLHEDEAAIEFTHFRIYNTQWGDSIMYAAYILRKKDSAPVFIPLFEEKQLERFFQKASESNKQGAIDQLYRGGKPGKENNLQNGFGDSLYKLVWQPLESYLNGIRKVSYSPSGKLFSIAFHALPTGNGNFLMDKFLLNQFISTRQIALDNKVQEKPGSIVLFGDASFNMDLSQTNRGSSRNNGNNPPTLYVLPNRGSNQSDWSPLPGTANEISEIENLFKQNGVKTLKFSKATASESNLKMLSGQSYPVLHLATHGFFLPDVAAKKGSINETNQYAQADDPLLRSGLVLSGANHTWSGKKPAEGIEDGIVTAYEISQMNLSNTRLVVLSACETALGDVQGTEGVFGLQRAFKMAGVDKLIVSLWQVPDKETSELMTSFYKNWLEGKTIRESFNAAQTEMRNKKYPPYFWAAFVLIE